MNGDRWFEEKPPKVKVAPKVTAPPRPTRTTPITPPSGGAVPFWKTPNFKALIQKLRSPLNPVNTRSVSVPTRSTRVSPTNVTKLTIPTAPVVTKHVTMDTQYKDVTSLPEFVSPTPTSFSNPDAARNYAELKKKEEEVKVSKDFSVPDYLYVTIGDGEGHNYRPGQVMPFTPEKGEEQEKIDLYNAAKRMGWSDSKIYFAQLFYDANNALTRAAGWLGTGAVEFVSDRSNPSVFKSDMQVLFNSAIYLIEGVRRNFEITSPIYWDSSTGSVRVQKPRIGVENIDSLNSEREYWQRALDTGRIGPTSVSPDLARTKLKELDERLVSAIDDDRRLKDAARAVEYAYAQRQIAWQNANVGVDNALYAYFADIPVDPAIRLEKMETADFFDEQSRKLMEDIKRGGTIERPKATIIELEAEKNRRLSNPNNTLPTDLVSIEKEWNAFYALPENTPIVPFTEETVQTSYNSAVDFKMKEQKIRYGLMPHDPTASATWIREPKRFEMFIKALAEAELQKGQPLTTYEVRKLKQLYANAGTEALAEIIFDVTTWIEPTMVIDNVFPALKGARSAALLSLKQEAKRGMKAIPFVGKLFDEAVTTSADKAARNINDVINSIAKAYPNDVTKYVDDLEAIGYRAQNAIDNPGKSLEIWEKAVREIPGMSNVSYEQFLKLRDLADEAAGGIDPSKWKELYQSAILRTRDDVVKSIEHQVDTLARKEGLTETAKAQELTKRLAEAENSPFTIGVAQGVFSEHFKNQFLRGHRIHISVDGKRASRLMDDTIFGRIVQLIRLSGADENMPILARIKEVNDRMALKASLKETAEQFSKIPPDVKRVLMNYADDNNIDDWTKLTEFQKSEALSAYWRNAPKRKLVDDELKEYKRMLSEVDRIKNPTFGERIDSMVHEWALSRNNLSKASAVYLADTLEGVSSVLNIAYNFWATAVLSLNPRWYIQNLIDSSGRSMISGGNPLMDISLLFSGLHRNLVDDLGGLPIELGQSLARNGIDFSYSVPGRFLYGDFKPYFGWFSYWKYETDRLIKQGITNRSEITAKMADVVANKLPDSQFTAAMKRMGNGILAGLYAIPGASSDFNTAIEFTIRLRMFHREYFKLMGEFGSVFRDMHTEELSPVVKDLAHRIWDESGGNSARMARMAEEIAESISSDKTIEGRQARAWSLLFNDKKLDDALQPLTVGERQNFLSDIREKITERRKALSANGKSLNREEVSKFIAEYRESFLDAGAHAMAEARKMVQIQGIDTTPTRSMSMPPSAAELIDMQNELAATLPVATTEIDIPAQNKIAGRKVSMTMEEIADFEKKFNYPGSGLSGEEVGSFDVQQGQEFFSLYYTTDNVDDVLGSKKLRTRDGKVYLTPDLNHAKQVVGKSKGKDPGIIHVMIRGNHGAFRGKDLILDASEIEKEVKFVGRYEDAKRVVKSSPVKKRFSSLKQIYNEVRNAFATPVTSSQTVAADVIRGARKAPNSTRLIGSFEEAFSPYGKIVYTSGDNIEVSYLDGKATITMGEKLRDARPREVSALLSDAVIRSSAKRNAEVLSSLKFKYSEDEYLTHFKDFIKDPGKVYLNDSSLFTLYAMELKSDPHLLHLLESLNGTKIRFDSTDTIVKLLTEDKSTMSNEAWHSLQNQIDAFNHPAPREVQESFAKRRSMTARLFDFTRTDKHTLSPSQRAILNTYLNAQEEANQLLADFMFRNVPGPGFNRTLSKERRKDVWDNFWKIKKEIADRFTKRTQEFVDSIDVNPEIAMRHMEEFNSNFVVNYLNTAGITDITFLEDGTVSSFRFKADARRNTLFGPRNSSIHVEALNQYFFHPTSRAKFETINPAIIQMPSSMRPLDAIMNSIRTTWNLPTYQTEAVGEVILERAKTMAREMGRNEDEFVTEYLTTRLGWQRVQTGFGSPAALELSRRQLNDLPDRFIFFGFGEKNFEALVQQMGMLFYSDLEYMVKKGSSTKAVSDLRSLRNLITKMTGSVVEDTLTFEQSRALTSAYLTYLKSGVAVDLSVKSAFKRLSEELADTYKKHTKKFATPLLDSVSDDIIREMDKLVIAEKTTATQSNSRMIQLMAKRAGIKETTAELLSRINAHPDVLGTSSATKTKIVDALIRTGRSSEEAGYLYELLWSFNRALTTTGDDPEAWLKSLRIVNTDGEIDTVRLYSHLNSNKLYQMEFSPEALDNFVRMAFRNEKYGYESAESQLRAFLHDTDELDDKLYLLTAIDKENRPLAQKLAEELQSSGRLYQSDMSELELARSQPFKDIQDLKLIPNTENAVEVSDIKSLEDMKLVGDKYIDPRSKKVIIYKDFMGWTGDVLGGYYATAEEAFSHYDPRLSKSYTVSDVLFIRPFQTMSDIPGFEVGYSLVAWTPEGEFIVRTADSIEEARKYATEATLYGSWESPARDASLETMSKIDNGIGIGYLGNNISITPKQSGDEIYYHLVVSTSGGDIAVGKRFENPDTALQYARTFAINRQSFDDVSRLYQMPDVRDNENFRKWFAGSVVKDEDGNPMIMYHGGSRIDFEAYDKAKIGEGNLYGPGFYFTNNREVASSYTGKNSSSAKFPQRLTDPEITALFNHLGINGSISPEQYESITRRIYEISQSTDQMGWPSLEDIHFRLRDKLGPDVMDGYVARKIYDMLQNKRQYTSDTVRYAVESQLKLLSGYDRELLNQFDDWIRRNHGYTAQGVHPVYISISNPFDMDKVYSYDEVRKMFNDVNPGMGGALVDRYLRSDSSKIHTIALEVPEQDGMSGDDIWNLLQDLPVANTPTDKDVNNLLASMGYDGITHIGGRHVGGYGDHRVYIAFEPTQIKSIYNSGKFDVSNPNMLMQGRKKPKGAFWYTKDSKGNQIPYVGIFDTADATTAPHEIAHAALSELARKNPNDWRVLEVEKWTGMESGSYMSHKEAFDSYSMADRALKVSKNLSPEDRKVLLTLLEDSKAGFDAFTKMQEMYSDGLVVYLKRGIAPNARLAEVFAYFKRVLTEMWAQVKATVYDIPDEMVKVYDAMLPDALVIEKRYTKLGDVPTELAAKVFDDTRADSFTNELNAAFASWRNSRQLDGFDPTQMKSYDQFHTYLTNKVDDFNSEISRSVREVLVELEQFADSVASLRFGDELSEVFNPPIPQAQMGEGARAVLEYNIESRRTILAIDQALNELERAWIAKLDDGDVTMEGLTTLEKEQLMKWKDGAVKSKTAMVDMIVNGGRHEYKGKKFATRGALGITNKVLLDYGSRTNFDMLMRNLFPFWMFPSRSLPFWAETLVTHPSITAMYFRIKRASETQRYQARAVDSKGQPLRSLDGYIYMPGLGMWVNPLAPFSFRYLLDISRYSAKDIYTKTSDTEEQLSGTAYVMRELLESGPIIGFNVSPWIGFIMRKAAGIPESSLPNWSLAPQFNLLPKWWVKELYGRFEWSDTNPARAFASYWLFPEPNWQDQLIEQRLIQNFLEKYKDYPEGAELDAAVDALSKSLKGKEDTPEWNQAYKDMTQDDATRNMMAFFSGVYGKTFTDGSADIVSLKLQNRAMRDAMNNPVLAAKLGLPTADDERWQYYLDTYRYADTPEAFAYRLYSDIGWVKNDKGQVVNDPDERRKLVAAQIEMTEKSRANYMSRKVALETLNKELAQMVAIGAPYEDMQKYYKKYFNTLAVLDSQVPEYKYAGTGKPASLIEKSLYMQWWSSIIATRPIYSETMEYPEYEKAIAKWEANLPKIANTLVDSIMQEGNDGRMSVYFNETLNLLTPEQKANISPNLLDSFVKSTTAMGYQQYRMSNDTLFDAANEAYKRFHWDSYWDTVMPQVKVDNPYTRTLIEREWKRTHPDPDAETLYKWISTLYGDRFSLSEVKRLLDDGQGVLPLEDRKELKKTKEDSYKTDIWNMLSIAGPGAAGDLLSTAYQAAGGSGNDLTVWYNTEGYGYDNNPAKLKMVRDTLALAMRNARIANPTDLELKEREEAWRLKNQFETFIKNNPEFPKNFFQQEDAENGIRMGIYQEYQSKDYDVQADWRSQPENKETYALIKLYGDLRRKFAEANPLYRVYYMDYVPAKKQNLQYDTPATTSTVAPPSPVSEGGGSKVRQMPVNVPTVSTPLPAREVSRLAVTQWPSGFRSAVGDQVANEIEGLLKSGRYLSRPAKDFLYDLARRHRKWRGFIYSILNR